MPKTPRKPPSRVVAIKGQHEADLVTQAELAIVAQLQEAEWMASRAAQQAVMRLESRIQHGAAVEEGKLGYSRELRMVRSKKKENAG